MDEIKGNTGSEVNIVSEVCENLVESGDVFEERSNFVLNSEGHGKTKGALACQNEIQPIENNDRNDITAEEKIAEANDVTDTGNDTTENSTIEDSELNKNEVTVGPLPEKKSDKNILRLTRLPMSRIKSIMKFDDDVHMASQEAIFLVTKATELFIGDFMKEVYQCTLASKKKTVTKKDVDTAIFSQDYFLFLDGALD